MTAEMTGGAAALWGPPPAQLEHVIASDGASLAIERYGDRGHSPGGPTLVFIHGIGAYAGPYRRLARSLAGRGAVVYLPHLRGHGDSQGRRGLLGSPKRVTDDVRAIVEYARAYASGELVLGGESMGALIALRAATRLEPAPGRLLFLAPALRLGWAQLVAAAFDPDSRPQGLLSGIPAHGSMPAEAARHPVFKDACRTDPLMVQRVKLRYLLTLASMMSLWSMRYPKRLPQPALIVQGDADRLLDAQGAALLAKLLPAGELRLVEGAWHNLLWDPTAEQTTDAIGRWLLGK